MKKILFFALIFLSQSNYCPELKSEKKLIYENKNKSEESKEKDSLNCKKECNRCIFFCCLFCIFRKRILGF